MTPDCKKGIVLYCDASARPNPGKIGIGIHGYIYTKKENNKAISIDNNFITDKGYIPKNNTDVTYVTPLQYLDFVGSNPDDGTNNQGELEALNIALSKILEINKDNEIDSIFILTDSQYVVTGISDWLSVWKNANWIKQNGTPIININFWKIIDVKLQTIKDLNININIEWVRGHNNDFGNTRADYLSVIGMNYATVTNECRDIFTISEASGYWKHNLDKHPFINFKRVYFNTISNFNIAGQYFQADSGASDYIIGKRIPEAGFSVIRLKDTENLIEMIRSKQCKVANDNNAIVMVKLDRAYSKEVYPYLVEYGEFCLLPNKQNLNLNFVDNKPITVENNPTGLSMRAIETFNYLEDLLDQFIRIKNSDYIKYDSYNKLNIHDITHRFYDIEEKQTKKGITKKHIIKQEISNLNDIKVDIVEEYNGKDLTITVPLILGLDILPRNNMKKLESHNPSVLLITWRESNKTIRYAIIIECNSGIGIWSNFFSDKLFLT